ncbi:MAG: hypothetical protein EA378_01240 [Phycisphaerales bacterium]|nr:MAG: hypothetical protein EA378_01240 [Phycisphaerales bacterium]
MAASLGLLMLLGGCGDRHYDQSTPERTLESASAMVANGEPQRLTSLIWAEDEATRQVYDRLGRVLKRGGDLAVLIQERFPEDVKRVQSDLDRAGASGQPTVLERTLTGGNRRARTPQAQREQRQQLEAAIRAIFADPYGFLERGRDRLGTTFVNDTSSAITWDGRLVLPPFGLLIQQQDDGKWYLTLPTQGIPQIKRFLPSASEDMAMIWMATIQLLDNVLVDMDARIRSGRYRSLDEAARGAGEMIFLPGVMLFAAFQQASESERPQ